jgi:alpha-D-xyloside xylohydrolase
MTRARVVQTGIPHHIHKTGECVLKSSAIVRIFFIAVPVAFIAASSWPLEADTLERNANGVTLHTLSGALQVEVCSDNVIHVVASPTQEIPHPIVPVVIRPCNGARFRVASTRASVAITVGDLRVEIDRTTDAVRFLNEEGSTVLSEQSTNGRTLTPEKPDGANTYEVRQSFLLSAGEALYGLGQHQEGFFDIRDIPIRLLQANTNIAVPFLISTKGYGLLWNDPALTDFNPATRSIQLDKDGQAEFQSGSEGDYGFLLSGNFRDKLQLTVGDKKVIDLKNMWLPLAAGGKIHLTANTSYKVTAETGANTALAVRFPSDSMTFSSGASRAIDYYFLYGPEPVKVIADYRELTGQVPLLPRWAYGFWQCRERYASQEQILDTAAEFRKRNIPVDALVQDWQYWGKYGWNAMRFDESAYPDPAQLMSDLHSRNLHMVISVWAKFGNETQVNHDMANSHLLLTSSAATGEPGEAKENESWADLFNPAAQKLYWSEIARNLFRQGLDGWWLDASEPEGDPLKNDDTYLGPGKTVRNAYPLFETSAVYNGQRAATEHKRVVILSRSAFAGQQRNGSISWSGDISATWETLRRQIPAGLSFGMSGFPYWTTDIGGFFRPEDQYTSAEYHQLLIRWFQFGAFCPIFRIHGFRSRTEMWNYGPDVDKILEQYDALRYRLLPYIYSAAWGVTDRNQVMMRALPLVYPDQLALRQVSDEFLFGDSLLINPVTEPNATSRKVVLPAGDDWVDFWTGKKYRGGQAITAEAPLDRIPILVKEGSILPMGPVVQSAEESEDPLEIRVYAGRDADYDLYEDGGDGYAYEHGARAVIHFHWDDRLHTLSVGDTKGTFPGIESKHNLRVVQVQEGKGTGMGLDPTVARSLVYVGKATSIRLKQ